MNFPILAVVNLGDISLASLFPDVETANTASCENESGGIVLHIKCKYYHADIRVREIAKETDLPNAEAIIVFFDGKQASSWCSARRWMTLASERDLPLRLLVCRSLFPVLLSNGVHQDSVEFRRQAVESEFELIELEPEEDSLEEGEEFGVRRLKSAIESHTWSNMKLLESASCPLRAAYSTDVSRTATECIPTTPDTHRIPKSPSHSDGKLSNEDTDLQLDETVESFERMFTRLRHARDKLPYLSRPDRQRLAEQVVMEFWRTIGGSSDELNEID